MFNEIWEILLCHEGTDTPEDVAEYRLRAFILLLKDEKRLEKTNDRFVRTLKVQGAIPILKQMFGVEPNEPTTTRPPFTTGPITTGPKPKTVSPFEAASRAIFG